MGENQKAEGSRGGRALRCGGLGGCFSCRPLRRSAEQGPAALLLHEAPVSSAARAGLRRLSRRPLPSAAAVAPAGGGGGACRTVSIGPQVLVGAGAGAWAWAAEGAGLRAAVSRTELGLLSGRGTRRRRSPKPRASCSRRRCASPGRPRRQGPSARSPPAPRGLPGPGRSQVRSRSRGPRPPGPNASPRPCARARGRRSVSSFLPVPRKHSPRGPVVTGWGRARNGVWKVAVGILCAPRRGEGSGARSPEFCCPGRK